jgi:hypothetical protein
MPNLPRNLVNGTVQVLNGLMQVSNITEHITLRFQIRGDFALQMFVELLELF